MSDSPKLAFRLAEACEATGVSRSTMNRLLAAGEIRARKVGRATVIERAELERYLSTCPPAEYGK